MLRSVCLGVVLLVVAGCGTPQPTPTEFRPTATVKDIMDSMIDPSADAVWEAVATISTAAGIEERQPRTDEEWAEVRRRAITLEEVTNLLLMPRRVAQPGEKSTADVELDPEEIDALIKSDPVSWVALAHGLHDSIQPALKAIEAKSASGLLDAGEAIDVACENCHRKYWYPNDKAPAN